MGRDAPPGRRRLARAARRHRMTQRGHYQPFGSVAGRSFERRLGVRQRSSIASDGPVRMDLKRCLYVVHVKPESKISSFTVFRGSSQRVVAPTGFRDED